MRHPSELLSRLPWFEELRARAERALADRQCLIAELRAALGELSHVKDRAAAPRKALDAARGTQP
jgi:hypothetical protein